MWKFNISTPGVFLFDFPQSNFTMPLMSSTDFDIKYVANLARIELSPEEEITLGGQLGNILAYIEKLKELDVQNIEPMAHAVQLTNVVRSDEVGQSLSPAEVLQNAPVKTNDLFIVPKIVE